MFASIKSSPLARHPELVEGSRFYYPLFPQFLLEALPPIPKPALMINHSFLIKLVRIVLPKTLHRQHADNFVVLGNRQVPQIFIDHY